MGKAGLVCEVKTINASDDELKARRSGSAKAIPVTLPEAFFLKLERTLTTARSQLAAHAGKHPLRLIYVVLNFDDHLHEHLEDYLEALRARSASLLCFSEEVVFSVLPPFYFASPAAQPPLEIACSLSARDGLLWQDRTKR